MSKDKTIDVDGPRVAAQILSHLPRDTRTRLVESIRVLNPQSAVKIESIIIKALSPRAPRSSSPQRESHEPTGSTNSTPISTITQISDTRLQEKLREVPARDLAVSLKNAPREAQEKVLSNISSTKQHAVLDELQQLPPMRVSDVEAAQARLLKSVEDVYADDAPAPPPPTRRLRSRLA
ncbi:MAG: FliG C-terminal domain-containing protein [Pseudomonadota bacterium]|jgi:flagellar motor switch protein FliG